MHRIAFTLLVCTLPIAAASAATPCDTPERFVRASSRPAAEPAPLLRPYVLGGIAAVAMREDGGQRWLELAVHSADEARRQLAGQGGDTTGPTVSTWHERVWLRCPGSPSRT